MNQTQKISTDTVAKMAQLSRLDIPEEQRQIFAAQFGDILSYMDVLEHVDTDGVAPLYSPVRYDDVVRVDTADNKRNRDEVLNNAPEQDGQYFIVPRIV